MWGQTEDKSSGVWRFKCDRLREIERERQRKQPQKRDGGQATVLVDNADTKFQSWRADQVPISLMCRFHSSLTADIFHKSSTSDAHTKGKTPFTDMTITVTSSWVPPAESGIVLVPWQIGSLSCGNREASRFRLFHHLLFECIFPQKNIGEWRGLFGWKEEKGDEAESPSDITARPSPAD